MSLIDSEYVCSGNDIPPTKNVLYVDISNNTLMAGDIIMPTINSVLIQDSQSLLSNFNWSVQTSIPLPKNTSILLTTRNKRNCNSLNCSYGASTLWLDIYNNYTKLWYLNNLSTFYGKNSSVDGWAIWLNSYYILFNAWNSSLLNDNKQIFSLYFNYDYSVKKVELYCSSDYYDPNSYTGRLSTMPNLVPNSTTCFNGQKLSFVRRTNLDQGTNNSAIWNSDSYYYSNVFNNMCINSKIANIPVLKTYVVYLYNNCTPIKSWNKGELLPVKTPMNNNYPFKQMGVVPEWGDMQSSISLDGGYLAVATNRGPSNNISSCAGFNYVLTDTNNILSGYSSRQIYWCSLVIDIGNNIICNNSQMINPNNFSPVGSGTWPFFYPMYNQMTLLFTLNWAQYKTQTYSQLWQNNLNNSYQQMFFGTSGNNISNSQNIFY